MQHATCNTNDHQTHTDLYAHAVQYLHKDHPPDYEILSLHLDIHLNWHVWNQLGEQHLDQEHHPLEADEDPVLEHLRAADQVVELHGEYDQRSIGHLIEKRGKLITAK